MCWRKRTIFWSPSEETNRSLKAFNIILHYGFLNVRMQWHITKLQSILSAKLIIIPLVLSQFWVGRMWLTVLKPGLQYSIPASRQVFFNLHVADASKQSTATVQRPVMFPSIGTRGKKIMLKKVGQLSNRCLYMGAREHVLIVYKE